MSETIQAHLTIATTPATVFEALCQNEAVTSWFADAADIVPEQQRYDFWGRFTPEVPDREAGHHPLLRYQPEHSLAFHWYLRGVQTTVTISLEPVLQGTEVILRHDNVADRQDSQYSLADFWGLSLENLRGWVERRQIGARCDFSLHSQGDVHLSIDISAPPESVFAALIRPDQLERYIATQATVVPQVGGRYDFGWEGGGPVKILELLPNERLAYSWEYPGEPPTVVSWTLEGSGGQTRLVLVHSGFGTDRINDDYSTGWLKFLNSLKFLVEEGSAWQAPAFSQQDYVV